ncbi:MAG: alanyl-tRNA editing protein [Clostridia bacterium]|nr:alanyl-tRNA editing protein [Clostridia bacterium]
MTERLYNSDAYLKTVTAKVTGKEGEFLIFDRTVFAPDSGGQNSDLGTVGGMKVLLATERDGEILHQLSREDAEGVSVGDELLMEIDWERRFDHMQNHIGEHILSGLFKSEYDLDNKGFRLGEDVGTFDIDSREITQEMLDRIEELANDVVYRSLPVQITMVKDAEEAKKYPLRKELKADEDIIIVSIPGVDCVACCCPHPSDTSQVGIIKITGTEKYKGMTRISFKCGKRALMDYRQKHRVISMLAEKFSADEFSLPEKVAAADRKNDEMHRELNRMKGIVADIESARLMAVESPVIAGELAEGDMDVVRRVSRKITDNDSRPAIVSSASDCCVLLAFSGEAKVDFGAVVKAHAAALGGKGGGKPGSAQAFFGDVESMRSFVKIAVEEAERSLQVFGI